MDGVIISQSSQLTHRKKSVSINEYIKVAMNLYRLNIILRDGSLKKCVDLICVIHILSNFSRSPATGFNF